MKLGTFNVENLFDRAAAMNLLMSPKLAATVEKAGLERRGAWGGKNGTLFPHLPEIKSAKDAASDHAALWVELDI
jgi:hypothetical protein